MVKRGEVVSAELPFNHLKRTWLRLFLLFMVSAGCEVRSGCNPHRVTLAMETLTCFPRSLPPSVLQAKTLYSSPIRSEKRLAKEMETQLSVKLKPILEGDGEEDEEEEARGGDQEEKREGSVGRGGRKPVRLVCEWRL